jgi:heme A synthase
MKSVHLVVGLSAIGLNAAAALYGGWCWWRGKTSDWFWRILRAAQGVVVLQVLLGGVLVATGHTPKGLHVIYGLLPLLVSLFAEQLRIGSAQMVLESRGHESAQAVGRLPEDEQHGVVMAIVQREIGVMALSALINVVLLGRAAMTAG